MKGLYCAAFHKKGILCLFFSKMLYCAVFEVTVILLLFSRNDYTATLPFITKRLYCATFSRKGCVVSPFLESAILCYFSSKGFSVALFHNKSMLYFSRKGYTAPLFYDRAILCRYFIIGLLYRSSRKGYQIAAFSWKANIIITVLLFWIKGYTNVNLQCKKRTQAMFFDFHFSALVPV